MGNEDEVYSLRVRPGSVTKESERELKRLRALALRGKRKKQSQFSSRGRGVFLLQPRAQLSVVKASYSRNTKSASWSAHGRYLSREGTQEKGEKSFGFDSDSDGIEISKTLSSWQQQNDPRVFKLIISPERGAELDLKDHARELMKKLEADMETKLSWVGVLHTNTKNPHLHICLRGVDEKGQGLKVESLYLSSGIRSRSEELVTNRLGLKTAREILEYRERQIKKERFTVNADGKARDVAE